MGAESNRVALLPTCIVDAVSPELGVAVVRSLRALGVEVDLVSQATCCGQPAWNAGHAEEAAAVARTTLQALDASGDEMILVPAGSCATMIRVFWRELFHLLDDTEALAAVERVAPRVTEYATLVAEHLDDLPTPAGTDKRVAYHHSCHMLRELGIREAPVDVLRRAAGVEPVAWSADDRCCGFGGLFSVKQPETSVAMADDKLDSLADAGADVLVGCDQSCLMHLEGRARRRGDDLVVRHLAEIVAEVLDA